MKRSMLSLALAAALASNLAAQAEHPGKQPPARSQDPFSHLMFPPELVMRHQGELGLQDSQRATLQQAMQQAQSKFVEIQWKLSSESEGLGKLFQSATVDEAAVLAQVNRILSLEREMKLAQMTLMVRVKNALTPQQQAKLHELRQAHMGGKEHDGDPERQ